MGDFLAILRLQVPNIVVLAGSYLWLALLWCCGCRRLLSVSRWGTGKRDNDGTASIRNWRGVLGDLLCESQGRYVLLGFQTVHETSRVRWRRWSRALVEFVLQIKCAHSPHPNSPVSGAVHAVAVSPQDTVVASASNDRTVRLWLPTAEGKCSVIRGHGGAVRTVGFSSDGKCLLTGSDDKTIKVWNVETEKFLLTLNGHMNWVRSAEFNGDGRHVVSGGDDKTLRLWDVEKHECIHTFTDIVGLVYCARFSPDGACIGSCGSDHSIQIRDIRSRILIQHYAGNGGAVKSICFHPSGNYLLSTCEDSTVKIWDLREGRMLYALEGHERSTTCAQYSPTGEYFASGSMDEHVMIWRSELNPTSNMRSGSLASAMKKHLRSLLPQPSNFWGSHQIQCDDHENQPLQLTAGSPDLQKDEESEHSLALQNIGPTQNSDQLDDVEAADLLAHLSENPEEGRVDSPKKRKVLDDEKVNDVKTESPIAAIELTLQRLVRQMDVLTRTISLFGERLSQTEDKCASHITKKKD